MPLPSIPRIVFLDRATLPCPVRAPVMAHEWVEHAHTAAAEVVGRLAGATVAITNKVPLDAATLAALPELKLIAVAATGYNQIDIAAAHERGIVVCNIRDYAVAGVPEHTLMLMLALRRNLLAYRHDVQAGAWQQAAGFCYLNAPLDDLHATTLVLIGSGALAQATAQLARAFGMRVVFAERKHAPTTRPGHVPFAEALAQADILSLHCPLNASTRNLIGPAELAQLKPTALLINTARGGLVDEAALLTALETGRLAGAGLDVLIEEPPRHGNPLLNANLPNLIITPHVAWASNATQSALAQQLTRNIEAFLQGTPRNAI